MAKYCEIEGCDVVIEPDGAIDSVLNMVGGTYGGECTECYRRVCYKHWHSSSQLCEICYEREQRRIRSGR